MQHHEAFMRSALNMARRGIGRTAPNPSVGCVIVKNGIIIARACTSDEGRPHAEKIALDQAGENAKGATLYVTLQPCTHHGATPPCAEEITKAGIKTVVIGSFDPNPKINGYPEGVEIITNILQKECDELNAGFFLTIKERRPFVTLKVACTIDGKIACTNGESKWITGELARRHTHMIRSQHDAILVGKGTARLDQPQLTTRLKGINHDPLKIILGETEFKCDPHNIEAVLTELADRGITRLLVEGGAQVHSSFLKAGMYDDLLVYRASTLLGAENTAMVAELGIETLTQRFDLTRKTVQILGTDILETYTKQR